MWLTEDEFEDLLYIIRKKPVNSRGGNPEEKYRRDRAIIYCLHMPVCVSMNYLT